MNADQRYAWAGMRVLLKQEPELNKMLKHVIWMPIVKSFRNQVITKGRLSDKQVSTLHNMYQGQLKRDAERAEMDNLTKVDAPEGRFTIAGRIITLKDKETNYGWVTKMTVAVEKDGTIWKTWGSVPRSLRNDAKKGSNVRFVATVERGDKDPSFSFFKRPSNAEILDAVVQPVSDSEVWCDGCKETHNSSSVEFFDIQEDAFGRDKVSFKCPEDSSIQSSLPIVRN